MNYQDLMNLFSKHSHPDYDLHLSEPTKSLVAKYKFKISNRTFGYFKNPNGLMGGGTYKPAWNGEDLGFVFYNGDRDTYTRLTEFDIIHEVCHYIFANEEQRTQPDFGLGFANREYISNLDEYGYNSKAFYGIECVIQEAAATLLTFEFVDRFNKQLSALDLPEIKKITLGQKIPDNYVYDIMQFKHLSIQTKIEAQDRFNMFFLNSEFYKKDQSPND